MIFHLNKSWQWFKQRAESTHTKGWLMALSFSESAIFIIPPDPLLAAIILAGSPRWIYYTIITTVASVLGAVFGYILGAFFFDTVGVLVVDTYGLQAQFDLVKQYFDGNTFGVILFAAITPIPFKVFVLTAGFLKVNFTLFLLASAIGRALRYTLVSFVTYKLKDRALGIVRKYTTTVTILSFVLFGIYIAYIVLGSN